MHTTLPRNTARHRVWIVHSLRAALTGIAVVALSFTLAHINYVLFHTLAEAFAILVAVLIFVIGTRTYKHSCDNFLLFLGNAYMFVAVLDFLHTMTYQGMGVFRGYDANTPTQLWIAGRYLDAGSLLVASFFIGRRFPRGIAFWLYALITTALVGSIMALRVFPDCFIPGQGLTTFKVGSEYLICAILLAAIWHLRSNKKLLDPSMYRLMVAAMATTIASELFFTLYSDVYGLMNLIGHLFKVLAYYLVYLGVVRRGLDAPYIAVKCLNEDLERKVAERTAELSEEILQREQIQAERERLHEEVERRAAELETIVGFMVEGLVIFDRDGKIVRTNDAANSILASISVSDGLFEVGGTGSEPPETGESPVARVMKGNTVHSREMVFDSHDGGNLWISLNGAPIFGRDGKIDGAVITLVDVTERKLLEQRLLRAQRLEAAGRVAAQVAHDFNNLLGPLVAYPDLIRMELPAGHPILEYCNEMQHAALQMASINENMMTLGRRGLMRKEQVDLNAVVRNAIRQMGHPSDALRVEVDMDPDILPVSGDPGQLQTMLGNLLSNARQAMNDSGVLKVRTENVYLDEPIEGYTMIAPGEYVRLTVADTGCGIPSEIRDKIFDPFFTTKNSDNQRGSGLGLSIVQAIVSDHDGRIDLQSEVGEGSTFEVYLPVCRDIAKESSKQELPRGIQRVLVVDDDRLQREVVGTLLRKLGYEVTAVASGEDAIAHIQVHHVDLVVLDMVMPMGMDGAETYSRMLEIRPNQRAIIVSGFAPSDRVELAQARGAGIYLSKPLTMEKLARAVREELDR